MLIGSPDMLNVAMKEIKYNNVKFKVADATDIPFEDNHFVKSYERK